MSALTSERKPVENGVVVSEEELVGQYIEGKLGRRAFIRRLVAGGISLGAALAYADALTSDTSAAAASGPGVRFFPRPPRHGFPNAH